MASLHRWTALVLLVALLGPSLFVTSIQIMRGRVATWEDGPVSEGATGISGGDSTGMEVPAARDETGSGGGTGATGEDGTGATGGDETKAPDDGGALEEIAGSTGPADTGSTGATGMNAPTVGEGPEEEESGAESGISTATEVGGTEGGPEPPAGPQPVVDPKDEEDRRKAEEKKRQEDCDKTASAVSHAGLTINSEGKLIASVRGSAGVTVGDGEADVDGSSAAALAVGSLLASSEKNTVGVEHLGAAADQKSTTDEQIEATSKDLERLKKKQALELSALQEAEARKIAEGRDIDTDSPNFHGIGLKIVVTFSGKHESLTAEENTKVVQALKELTKCSGVISEPIESEADADTSAMYTLAFPGHAIDLIAEKVKHNYLRFSSHQMDTQLSLALSMIKPAGAQDSVWIKAEPEVPANE